ncbi:MAG: endonuclease VII domain-containing protein, partial [Verrucomicrobia bacterium]|nr:endonuclease VII domain-containing protein [Verrucomicrobiota bacterium]
RLERRAADSAALQEFCERQKENLDKTLASTEPVKRCWGCHETKPAGEFAFLSGHTKKETGRVGCNNYCHACRHRQSKKRVWLLSKYGISVSDYETLLELQQGRCAICGTDKPPVNARGISWHLDHCHTNGHVRGILCYLCNYALGYFKDDAQRLENAAKYLKQPPARAIYLANDSSHQN